MNEQIQAGPQLLQPRASVFGECVFFDVGQGSANAILFKDKRAILIDTGRRESWRHVEHLLEDVGVRSIECVVLSHNDDDHVAGWEQCVMTFGDRIKSVFLVHDRHTKPGKTLDITWKLAEERLIPEPRRAERGIVWSDSDCTLEILSPNMRTSAVALEQQDANRCSAVVLFRYNNGAVLFSGDAGDGIWENMLAGNSGVPLKVDVATVPHHGSTSAASMFSQAIQADVAVISVSSNNSYGHPSHQAITGCLSSRAKVVCTQITPRCHGLTKLKGGNVTAVVPQSLSYNNPRYAGCRGTVISTLGHEGITHPWLESHRVAIRRLDSPMCIGDRNEKE